MRKRYSYAKCRCGLTKDSGGLCPERCPPPSGARYHRAVGVKPDTSPFPDIRKQVDIAAKRIGVPSRAWGSISEKGAAESRARRKEAGQ